jgi:hypothetical protein
MSEGFSLSRVTAAFRSVRNADGELELKEYTEAYCELNKFFPLLGRVGPVL